MRAVMPLSVIALFGLVAAGCKAKCHDPLKITDDDDGMTSEDKAEEEKALAKQPNLCSELRTPEIHVGTRISVKAGERTHAVARIADLPKEQMRSVDGLRTRLRFYKEHWKTLHPTGEFDGRSKINVDTVITPVRGVSILLTVVFAGFKVDSLHVGEGAQLVQLDNVDFWAPRLPAPDGKPEQIQSLCLDMRPGGQYALRFDPERPGTPPDAVSVASLPDAIGKACAGATPCADVVSVEEPPSHDFAALVRAAQTTLGAAPFAAKKPRVNFRTHVPKWTTHLGVPDETKWPCAKENAAPPK